MAGIAGLLTIYLFGHHNIRLSRSYVLEKEIRTLRYLETHEPISYAHAAQRYRELLDVIRFDKRHTGYAAEYERALARTLLKARIIELVQQHETTGAPEPLLRAHRIFTSPEYQDLEVYRSTSIYHNGQSLTQKWFRNAAEKADTRL